MVSADLPSEPMFYCPELASAGNELTLSGEELRHAHSARRLRVGDALWLFDGSGDVAQAIIRGFDRRARALRLELTARRSLPAPRPHVGLACALPKGERQAVLLDMATQLGLQAFWPLHCERSVARATAGAHRRWQRICLQACKQSRRPHLPALERPLTPSQAAGLASRGYEIWVADPQGAVYRTGSAGGRAPDRLLLVVGPEGGLTAAELGVLQAAGARRMRLGEGILRIETAAVALLACVGMEFAG